MQCKDMLFLQKIQTVCKFCRLNMIKRKDDYDVIAMQICRNRDILFIILNIEYRLLNMQRYKFPAMCTSDFLIENAHEFMQ